MRNNFVSTGLWIIPLSVVAQKPVSPPPPNVIVILADDLGCHDGNRFNKTPHLDKLAADGLRFTQAQGIITA